MFNRIYETQFRKKAYIYNNLCQLIDEFVPLEMVGVNKFHLPSASTMLNFKSQLNHHHKNQFLQQKLHILYLTPHTNESPQKKPSNVVKLW